MVERRSGEDEDQFASSTDQVLNSAAAIKGIDRLVFLAATTLVAAGEEHKGYPSTIAKQNVNGDRGSHPTSTAQCVSALQDLERIFPRLKSIDKSLRAEHTADRDPPPDFDSVQKQLRDRIEPFIKLMSGRSGISEVKEKLSSTSFGVMNPFTASQVFRSLVPAIGFGGPACTVALFVMLVWLNSRSSHAGTGDTPGNCFPNTAFLTGKCLDAVETMFSTLYRRAHRLDDLIGDFSELHKSQQDERANPVWQQHHLRMVTERILRRFDESSHDAALPLMFTSWRDGLLKEQEAKLKKAAADKKPPPVTDDSAEPKAAAAGTHEDEKDSAPCEWDRIAPKFSEAIKDPDVKRQIDEVSDTVMLVLKEIQDQYIVSTRRGSLSSLPSISELEWLTPESELAALDAATVNTLLNSSELNVVKAFRLDGPRSDMLHAFIVLSHALSYLVEVYRTYLAHQGDDLPALITTFQAVRAGLSLALDSVRQCFKPAVDSATAILMRQLAYESSGASTKFDAGELAQALRAVVRFGELRDLSVIESAVEVVCRNQRADGTWPSQQHFFKTAGGATFHMNSVEVAWALVSSINRLMERPREEFGISLSELLRRLGPAEVALRRTLGWLLSNLQQVPSRGRPAHKSARAQHFWGWSSDQRYAEGIIDLYTTANSVEFLVELRSFFCAKINASIRGQFTSYDPSALHPLSTVTPTDLSQPYSKRIVTGLSRAITPHAVADLVGHDWLPSGWKELETPDRAWSAIFAGPPGTSKTMLAKALAYELNRPLVVLSPSDFLAQGSENVERRARQIFGTLSLGSRFVYFFDEIDEVLLSRKHQQSETQRSAFSFLTPSLLTKFQDLHDTAEQNAIFFVLGTNYLDRIDPAAKRRGRVDRTFRILYPDAVSRESIAAHRFKKTFGGLQDFEKVDKPDFRTSLCKKIADTTALLSYQGIIQVLDLMKESAAKAAYPFSVFDDLLARVRDGDETSITPEFEWGLYHRRPEAVEEVIELLEMEPTVTKRVDILVRYGQSVDQDDQEILLNAIAKIYARKLATRRSKSSALDREAIEEIRRRVALKEGAF